MRVQKSAPVRRPLVFTVAPSMRIGLAFADDGMAQPKGQMILSVDFSSTPTVFDPAETPAMGTPYIFLYALHDALIRPLLSNALTPCLAELSTEIDDGLSVAFKLRQGSKFHNGDPLTAADVKLSLARSKEARAKLCRVTGTAVIRNCREGEG
jgi:peptide/nickel transport system substrate-binding protein